MLIYDSTFSTPALSKPGEPRVPEGQLGQSGASVLPKWQPCYWTGRYNEPYTDANVKELLQLAGPNRLTIIDFELCSGEKEDITPGNSYASDARTIEIVKRATGSGQKVATFGLYAGTFRTKYRGGKKHRLSNWDRASKRVLFDDMIMRRLDSLAPALNLMEYLTVEVENGLPEYMDAPYIPAYERWSEILEVRFPQKKRLAWIAGHWNNLQRQMTPDECAGYLSAAKARGDDCLCWGPWELSENFYKASLAYV